MKRRPSQILHKLRLVIFNFFALSVLVSASHFVLSAQSNWGNISIKEGGLIRTNLDLVNKCKKPRHFRINKIPGYLSFADPTDSILVDKKSTRKLPVLFDATGLESKLYQDELIVECLDCKKSEKCIQDYIVLPIGMTVVKPPKAPTPNPIPIITPAQTVTPTPTATPTPTPATPTPTIPPTPTITPTPTETPTPTAPTPIPTETPIPMETPNSTEPPTASATTISTGEKVPPKIPPDTSTLTLAPAEMPDVEATPTPDADVLQNPTPPAEAANVDYLNYLAIIPVLVIVILLVSLGTKKLFNKWKHGSHTAGNLGALKKTIAVKEELAGKWLRKRKNQNLHAIGVGKIDGTGDYCIQLFVENANGQMPDNPPIHLLPEKYRKFQIVIYEMPRAEFLNGGENHECKAKECHETIIGGISGANTNLANEYGTIGYFCAPTILRPIRKFRKEIYLLSNSHVFADLNKTKKDDNDLIQQPSPGENKRHNFIASLEKYVPILFDNDTENPNYIDAAIAKLFHGKEYRLEIPVIGKIKDYVSKEKVEIKQKCRKFGRTTGYTEGEIFSIHLSIWIRYAVTNQESFFKEQFLIVPTGSYSNFIKGGDSGSLVADEESKAIGLIFSGANSNTKFDIRHLPDAPEMENLLSPDTKEIKSFAVANPITEVLKGLNVKLIL